MVEECKVYTCDRCGSIYICKRIGTGPSENSDLDGYEVLPGTWNKRSRYGGMSVDQTVYLKHYCACNNKRRRQGRPQYRIKAYIRAVKNRRR